jgi:hypothetical protein
MTFDWSKALLGAAVLGFAGCAVGMLIDPRTMLASYLVTWFAVSAIPIGALAVLFTSWLVRGGWTRDLREPLTAAALTMPVVAVLFLPVILGLSEIYPWASDASGLPAFKAVYLTPWFFALRALIYFVVWTALALWAVRAAGDDAAMTRAASAGLIVWALTSSWAGIDWLESIEPHFHSSIYGLFAIDFDLLAGLGFGIVALLTLKRTRQMANTAYSGTLLAVLLLWAYMHAMQYIIIWTGNIPEEVIWYLRRLDGGWGVALWSLYILQFVVPFFVLLSERMRASSGTLLYLAVATLVLRWLEAAIFILPPLDVSGLALLLDLPAAMLLIGACCLLAWQFTIVLMQRRSGHAAPRHQHQDTHKPA